MFSLLLDLVFLLVVGYYFYRDRNLIEELESSVKELELSIEDKDSKILHLENVIEGAITYNPFVDHYKISKYFKETMRNSISERLLKRSSGDK